MSRLEAIYSVSEPCSTALESGQLHLGGLRLLVNQFHRYLTNYANTLHLSQRTVRAWSGTHQTVILECMVRTKRACGGCHHSREERTPSAPAQSATDDRSCAVMRRKRRLPRCWPVGERPCSLGGCARLCGADSFVTPPPVPQPSPLCPLSKQSSVLGPLCLLRCRGATPSAWWTRCKATSSQYRSASHSVAEHRRPARASNSS